MKRLWIINHYGIAPTDDGGTRHFSLAKYLRRSNWHTSIIASNIDHKTGKKRKDGSASDQIEEYEDVVFLWLNNFEYQSSGLKRILGMLHFSWRCLVSREIKALDKPEVVLGSTVHPFAALAGLILSRRYKVPFVFEVRDLWPQTLIDSGYIRQRSITAFVMRVIEKQLFEKSDLIVTLLPYVSSYIESLGLASKRVIWIPNGVDLENHQLPDLPVESQSRFCLMYYGAHGNMNGLETIIESLVIYKRENPTNPVYARFIGNGPLKEALRKLAAANGLDESDISFESSVPKSKIPEVSRSADAFIISVLDLPRLYRFGISMNKIADYMAAGRPVLIASGAPNNPVEEARCGITSPPEDSQALADAIRNLVNESSESRANMGKNGRNYVEENLAYSILAEKLAKELNAIAQN